VSRIFLSHSSTNNAEAVALRDWLEREGWKDEIFLDLDPQGGIPAGERWERALNEAANRCEAVLFLVSKAWLDSDWCIKEFNLAHHLNKRLFGLLIEDLAVADLPAYLTSIWQNVRLAVGRDHVMLRAVLPVTHEEVHVTFSAEGLQRLKHGLEQAGLDPKHFAWPPASDPNRPPYRGLRPLEAEDAGIFFGRDAPVIEALDQLRGLRETIPPRLLVILGASGSGKSSFLRAGLLPRLKRDDRHFLPLPIIRPERAAINGESGLLPALEDAFKSVGITTTRAKLRAAIEGGASTLCPLLKALADKATPSALDADAKPTTPTLILSVDQGEELFLAEGQDEARAFLVLLHDLLIQNLPAIIAVFTIRSDNYERLQLAKELQGLRQEMLSLPPMPKGSYAEVIKGPAQRLAGTERPLEVEDTLVNTLLTDIEAGGAKDALPLLAFTLERLYVEHGGDGDLTVAEYRSLGGITGSIEAAVARALKAADADPAIPKDRVARLALLRHGFIPWLAGIDPDTGAPRRRVARLSEVPVEAQPLIQHLVEQHLLATDVSKDTGEKTIEPAHEALLRQWGLLQGWLTEDAGLLAALEGVKRASRDWAANAKNTAWLAHATDRLAAAERLSARPDLAANLEPTDHEYLAACRKAEADTKRGKRLVQAVIYVLLVGVIAGLIGWINQSYLKAQWRWYATVSPFMEAKVRPYALSAQAERALKPLDSFKECAADVPCPEMVVIPAGKFMMGSPAGQQEKLGAAEVGVIASEGPQHEVAFAAPFAVSRLEITSEQWNLCIAYGDCIRRVGNNTWQGDKQPAIEITWDDARHYAAWLAKMTGKPYRLLTEAEWEYAARAGTTTLYSFGDDQATLGDYGWYVGNSDLQAHLVGEKKPNPFGLYDVHGNVREWVEDCFHNDYTGAPADGSAWTAGGDCSLRIIRGGSWRGVAETLTSAHRIGSAAAIRNGGTGMRIARTLSATAVAAATTPAGH
jgi:formylglycine-generating enzyme required for sulfatase activity